jgi:hypothetical protein
MTGGSRWQDRTDARRALLDAIPFALDRMTDQELWTEDSLRSRPEWDEIRDLAMKALDEFGWELRTPDKRFFG